MACLVYPTTYQSHEKDIRYMNNRNCPEEIAATPSFKESQLVVHVETNDVPSPESEVHIEAQLGIQWCLHPGKEFGHLRDIDAFPSKENVVSKG